jgi:hypothetical protein
VPLALGTRLLEEYDAPEVKQAGIGYPYESCHWYFSDKGAVEADQKQLSA